MKRSLSYATTLAGAFAFLTGPAQADYTSDFAKELPQWQAAAEKNVLTARLQDGALILENTTPENRYSHIHRPLAAGLKKPIEIRARVKVLNAPADRLFALAWHGLGNEMRFFEVQDLGLYSLYDWNGTGWVYQREKAKAPLTRQGEDNELAIRIVGQRAFYVLNGVVIDALDTGENFNPGIGFTVPSRTTIQISEFSARTLSGDAATLARAYEAEARASQAASGVIANLTRPLPLPFVDAFNDNEAGWPLQKDKSEITISDGKMQYENLSAEPNTLNWIQKELEKPIAGDFELRVTIDSLDGPEDGEAGLVFDLDGQGGRRVFQISKSKYVYYNYDGKNFDYETYVSTATPAVKAEMPNELVFRVLGKRAFFIVNGQTIYAVDYPGMRAANVGVAVSAGVLATFDRLEVKPLALSDGARMAEMKKLEAEARAALIAGGPELKDQIETFDDNQRNWPYIKEGETWAASIANGKLTWANKDPKNSHTATIALPINQAADYEITMRARFVSGNNTAINLIWGRSDNGDAQEAVGFSGNGYWIASTKKAGAYTTNIPWLPTSALKLGEMNDIQVKKIGDTLFYLINGQVLSDIPARRLAGSQIGVDVTSGVTAEIDEIRLSYPQRTDDQVAKEKQALLAKLEANHGKQGLGVVHSVAKKKEDAAAEYARLNPPKPSEKDYKELDKLRRRYVNKSMLKVLADMPRPARRVGSPSAPWLYYHYKTMGRTDYYYEFQCMYTGPQGPFGDQTRDPKWITVTNIVLTDFIQVQLGR